MSNHSEFMILIGTGHPYGGEGMITENILSLHMKKGGWFFATGDGLTYWANSSIEDALLMISLYSIAPYEPEDSAGMICQNELGNSVFRHLALPLHQPRIKRGPLIPGASKRSALRVLQPSSWQNAMKSLRQADEGLKE